MLEETLALAAELEQGLLSGTQPGNMALWLAALPFPARERLATADGPKAASGSEQPGLDGYISQQTPPLPSCPPA